MAVTNSNSTPSEREDENMEKHERTLFPVPISQTLLNTSAVSQSHEGRLSRMISGLDEEDARSRYDLEAKDNRISSSPNSVASSINSSERKIIHWDDEDPENPYNFTKWRKITIVFIGALVVINSTMGSSLPSNAIPFIAEYFHITSSTAEILPISTYLIGYVVGPLLWGPLSEAVGRRWIMISTFLCFTIFTMACAVAPNWSALNVFRFFTGCFASAPIAVIGGVYADIYNNPADRGKAMAVFIGGTCVGPLVAPVISGFLAPVAGWRWVFWFGLLFTAPAWIFLYFLPETFGPILLVQRAKALRKSTGNENIIAPMELEKKGFKQLATVTLTRPVRLVLFEPIVSATCAYVSVAYGIFYLYFQAYPVIFQSEIYRQSPGVSGLMFLPIAGGIVLATVTFLVYDDYVRKAIERKAPWAAREETRRLPLACIGGPLYVVALFWLGWSARENVPFWVPMLSGVPFGMGFVLIFMALLNYLADAYTIFSASAMSAASCCRALAGAVLPFAASSLYGNLGVAWASSLLGFISLGMCVVPFLFLWKGDKLRAGSRFCIYLREQEEKELEELERERAVRNERSRRTAGRIEEKV